MPCHIQTLSASPVFVEFLDARDVGADAVAVLDAHEGDLLSFLEEPSRIGARQCDPDAAWRNLFGEAMDGVELGGVGVVSSGEARTVERSLSDVDRKEDGIETTGLHFREVDLRAEPLTVVELADLEIAGLDVDMGVEGQRLPVDRLRPGRQFGVGHLAAGRLGNQRAEGEEQRNVTHEDSGLFWGDLNSNVRRVLPSGPSCVKILSDPV
jgi:hypothetical protein